MDDTTTQCACGARLPVGAAWCQLCFAPTRQPERAVLAAQPPPPGSVQSSGSPRSSRFQATDVTFGPVGRLVVTVLVLVPLAAFVAALAVAPIAGITGIVIWGGGIAPKALRDTWRRRPNQLR